MRRPLLLCLALAALLRADTLIVVGGADYHGKILSQENGEILINPYNSTMRQMTWGLKRFDRVNVQTVTIEPPTPLQEYWFRKGDPKADHAELLKWCQDHGLAVEAKEEALELLARDAKDAPARAVLGNEVDLILKASPRHNPDLRAATANWGALDAAGRRAAYAKLKKDFGVTLPQAYFDRVARSAVLPSGQTVEDRELTYNTRRASGVYTVWTPKNYDPHRSYPLVLALHGTWNGLGGIGEGHSFIRHLTHKETQKWDIVVVSPTADPRPWTAKGDDFVLAVMAEAMLLYNIDMNRVYATGHSMGGRGTYHFGVTYADRFAAFAPAASGPGDLDLLKAASQGTGIYIYHSSDDSIASCRSDRQAAKKLERARADFVYTEWTDQDHGWPQEVIADSFLYFRHRHRMERGKDKPVPCRGVRPSFAEPLWPDEELYFRPARAPGRPGEVEELVKDVELGGRLAHEAATRLLDLKNPAGVPLLAAVLR
ncbi:MAG: hypothetical protein HUU15_11145, partial [Candidatus Brocadiae bacterium]|nr:hypothetical protein [Candidatus Brocadiia bacterium]